MFETLTLSVSHNNKKPQQNLEVKGPAQEIQFLGIKWQNGRRQIPMDVINKITAMSPPTSKKETQAFLGVNSQGSGDKMTGTAATAAPPATGTAAAPDNSVTSSAVTPAPPVTDEAVQPGNQPVPVSVAPIHKKKSWKRKSARLEREDERAGPSQGEEEEEEELLNEMETT
ncbi:hypothetical protein QYF61_007388 [Mycteria americana]|uniref:Uncharacterized protein n=1 Tax=Mycteria americana TaxID=33587 RepID=A0AAN7NG25_MYCAM|nr:hypothetical protein QYF61_007388 [Mycteria americana]